LEQKENIVSAHVSRSNIQPAPELDRLEAATDQAIAACGGDARQAVTALIVANEFLEAQVRELQAAVSEFLIDAPIVHGSSGSPVFLFSKGASIDERSNILRGSPNKFVGIVFGAYEVSTNGKMKAVPAPTGLRETPVVPIPIQLGSCIKSSRLHEFEPHMIEKGLYVAPPGYVLHKQE
jgi:hypothetical protein